MKSEWHNTSDQELIRRWGDCIKRWRLEADWSQTDLAEKTGMSRSSIAGIEKGRNFSVGSLIAIARALEKLHEFDAFFKEEEYKLSPMEIYEREQKKKKRGGYNK